MEMTADVGSKLRQAREKRSLSLDDVARETYIRKHYLLAMEAGDFGALPSLVQARGFLRTYAEYLNIDPGVLLAGLEETGAAAPDSRPERPASSQASPAGRVISAEAGQIFAEVGAVLKERREVLGFSLKDIERHTHLRRHYLEALETGQFDDLPSPVQGRGMLSNYASFLGLDLEPLLLRFADGLQADLAAKQAIQSEDRPQKSERRPRRRAGWLHRILSGDILFGGAFVLFLAVFVVWGAIRIFSLRAGDVASPTAPSIAEVLLATETPSPTAMPALITSTPLPPVFLPADITTTEETPGPDGQPAAGEDQGGVQVYLTVHQRTWLRVIVDGDVVFQGRVLPGSAYSYAAEERIEIMTGNGEALQVFYNSQDLGLMGVYGQVVERIFVPEGVQTSTPTITPTGTATPRPSATPRRSPTPRGTLPALP